jgi:hypothetical protein
VRASHFIAFLLAAGAAGAEEATSAGAGSPTGGGLSAGAPVRSGPLTVTYRSQTAVYLSAGRAAGLAVGDRLALMSGTEKAAELEVVFLADHSSSCRVVAETRPVKPGDKLVRLGPPRTAPPADGQREFTVTTPASLAPAAYGSASATRDTPQRWARVSGGASVGVGGFQDSSGKGRNLQEQALRADVSASEIMGMPLEARVRMSGRRVERDGLPSLTLKAVDTRQRLYEASVAWVPVGGRFAVAAGRLGGGAFAGMGYLDGFVGQARPAAGVQVGGFFGRTPDALDVGLPTGAKYGAFVRFARQGRTPGELVFSGAREFAGSEISREYVGQQAQLRSGNVWLFERMEIDLNTGWRRERAGDALDVSEARALLTWRAAPEADLSVSYDRSRNYWSALTRGVSSELFDRRLRQSLRADLQVSRPGGLGFWVGASGRTEEGSDYVAYAAHGGIRSPRFASFNLSVEGSFYSSAATHGMTLTALAGRSLGGGQRLDFAYIANRYQSGGGAWNMSQWLRASGYAQGFGRAFGRLDLEYAIQDPVPGLRGLAEVGLRF